MQNKEQNGTFYAIKLPEFIPKYFKLTVIPPIQVQKTLWIQTQWCPVPKEKIDFKEIFVFIKCLKLYVFVPLSTEWNSLVFKTPLTNLKVLSEWVYIVYLNEFCQFEGIKCAILLFISPLVSIGKITNRSLENKQLERKFWLRACFNP